MFDYNYLTNNDADISNEYFTDLKKSNIKDSDEKFVEDKILTDVEDLITYVDKIIYIQDNYDVIVTKLTNNEKVKLDRYLLNYALLYYYESNSNTVPAEFNTNEITSIPVEAIPASNQATAAAVEADVAMLRIFSDGSTNVWYGSSGLSLDLGVHAWVTVTNISSSYIYVGAMTIAPGKTISIGTYGNMPEVHSGIWYDLEAYIVSNGGYSNRVSLTEYINPTEIATMNNIIAYNNNWSYTANCSTFATRVFNSVSTNIVSAGLINTPKTLSENIKAKSTYGYNLPVPFDYIVYYYKNKLVPYTF